MSLIRVARRKMNSLSEAEKKCNVTYAWKARKYIKMGVLVQSISKKNKIDVID